MASTRPSDIADISHDGDTDLTPITNAMAAERGFPMELRAGGVVNIVRRKQTVGGRFSFTASDGTEYVLDGGHTGKLVEMVVAEEAAEPLPAPDATGLEEGASNPEDEAAAEAAFKEAQEGASEDAAGEETITE